MPAAADDEVVVERDADRGQRLGDGAGHVDIRLRGRGVAGRVIVHHDER